MRTYESLLIVHPEVAGDDYTALVEKLKGMLTDQGAEVLKIDEWGMRTLAYPIEKQAKGNYIMFIYDASPETIAEFERRLRIQDKVMRFQTVKLEEGFEAPAPAETVEEAAPEATE